MATGLELPAIPVILSTALVDSINPCAIGVLILMMATLLKFHHDKARMLKIGLNSCLLETSAVATTANGKINTFNITAVKNLLSQNIIPVMSGDVVSDSKKGISILSGDQIVVFLAKKLSAKQIIFVSDVDGVFDKNPKTHKDAKLIKEINRTNYKQVLSVMKTHNTNDITGEMKGKILAIKKNTEGTPVIIANGFKKGMLMQALGGANFGTRLLFLRKKSTR